MTSRRRTFLTGGVIVMMALGVVAALAALAPRLVKSCTTPAGAARELSTIKADVILAFRAPGATLEASSEQKARDCNVMGERSGESTVVAQTLAVTGDPATAVEAYVAPARAAGWELRVTGCSRPGRSVRIDFLKDEAPSGTTAQLHVVGTDPYPPAPRRVFVQVDARDAVAHLRPDETSDLHCIRPVKADDPQLRPFAVAPTRTPAEMCQLLSPADLQSRGLTVSGASAEVDDGVSVCRYPTDRDRTDLLVLRDASTLVPAVYEDRRLSAPAPGDDRLYFVASEFSLARAGVWIAGARGPVLLEIPTQPDNVVLTLAQLIQGRIAR